MTAIIVLDKKPSNHYDSDSVKFDAPDFDDFLGYYPEIFLGLEVVDRSQYIFQNRN